VTDQRSLFDAEEGARRRDDGMQRADEHAPDDWKVHARAAVWQLARTGLPFTTDDVWLLLLGKGVAMPPEARALGAIMQAAARGGYIRKTGDYRESERAVCHRNPKAVWQGTKRAVW